MKSHRLLILLLMIIPTCLFAGNPDKVSLVDMFMGVKNSSNCVIGPQLPHGSVNPAPQTPNGGHNGYDENDVIRGFGQLHVSGIGWARYGQVFISPQIGFKPGETEHDSPKSDEIVTPYYYKVNLDRYKIKAEIAPSHHSVCYRFTYPKSGNKNILLDMKHNIPQHIVPIVKGRFLGGNMDYDEASGLLTGWANMPEGSEAKLPIKYFSPCVRM